MTSNGVQVLQCWYDGSGRRIAKKEIVGGATNAVMYVYDGWNVMAVLNQQGQLLEHYTRGLGLGGDIGTIIAETRFSGGTATNTCYYHNNHRGDVTTVRQGTSTVATFDYAPFGQTRSMSGSYSPRFRFSSKELKNSLTFQNILLLGLESQISALTLCKMIIMREQGNVRRERLLTNAR